MKKKVQIKQEKNTLQQDVSKNQKKSNEVINIQKKIKNNNSLMNNPYTQNLIVNDPYERNNTNIQAKLNISNPGDASELEADRIAENIISEPNNKINNKIQTKSNSSSGTNVSGKLASEINNLSGGQNLSETDQNFFGSKLGTDFSNIKIHNDNNAHQMTNSLNAKAFTYGNHIVFNKGEYQPETNEGKKLMAHELVHTVQQGNKKIYRKDKKTEKYFVMMNLYKPGEYSRGIGLDIYTEKTLGTAYYTFYQLMDSYEKFYFPRGYKKGNYWKDWIALKENIVKINSEFYSESSKKIKDYQIQDLKSAIKEANDIGNKAYKTHNVKKDELTPEIRKRCSKLFSFLGGEDIPPEMWNPEAVKRLASGFKEIREKTFALKIVPRPGNATSPLYWISYGYRAIKAYKELKDENKIKVNQTLVQHSSIIAYVYEALLNNEKK